MSADLYFTGILLLYLLLFYSSANLRARWTELNDWPRARK